MDLITESLRKDNSQRRKTANTIRNKNVIDDIGLSQIEEEKDVRNKPIQRSAWQQQKNEIEEKSNEDSE